MKWKLIGYLFNLVLVACYCGGLVWSQGKPSLLLSMVEAICVCLVCRGIGMEVGKIGEGKDKLPVVDAEIMKK